MILKPHIKKMKILYALQATGNGHISRANEILPILTQLADVDVLLSGTQSNIELNHYIKFRRKGLSFVFGKNGGIDYLQTLKKIKSKQFLTEIKSLPVDNYDLVINDFEPLSAWACKTKNIPCISLSHQYAVLDKAAPKPINFDPFAWVVLKYYAPCKIGIGFHFKSYTSAIFTPVIRSEIRNAYTRNLGHYTVYLPAYSTKKIIKMLSFFREIQWHVFSKECKKSYGEKNCWIRPINAFDFTGSFINCEGIITGGGFETPAEALFMKKKLLVIPMKKQYEQQCNAAALNEMGVTVIKSLKKKHLKIINDWLLQRQQIEVDYADNTLEILQEIIKNNTAPLLDKHFKATINKENLIAIEA
jgi:uncharacterized protein (TIGR00661 family)